MERSETFILITCFLYNLSLDERYLSPCQVGVPGPLDFAAGCFQDQDKNRTAISTYACPTKFCFCVL